MMVANFLPVLNLLNQFLKQISKPVSFRIVKYAKTHPVFRKYFLIIPGRSFHAIDERVRRRTLGIRESNESTKKEKVDDEAAIEAGANLMSECIIFLIAGLGVMAEVIRNSRNSAYKENIKLEQMKRLIEKKEAVSTALEKHSVMINKLEKLVDEYTRLTPSTTPSSSPENTQK